MKHTIRLFLALAALLVGSAGTAKTATNLTIVKQVTNATVETYVSTDVPTASYTVPSSEATTIQPGQYLVIKVTPATGKWTYSDLFKIEKGVGIGSAESRPRRAGSGMNLGDSPTALSTNTPDGAGFYYYQIPTTWTDATAVFVKGSTIDKISLNGATLSGTTLTTATRTDGWQATITLDQVSWTYDGSAHCPAISSISVTNGTKSFTVPTTDITISGEQTNASTTSYNATLSPVASSCLTGSGSAAFSIGQVATEITVTNATLELEVLDEIASGAALTPAEAGSLTYTSNKENVAIVESGIIKAVGDGTATITVSFSGNTNYAAADSKTITVNVGLNDASIGVDNASVELLVGGTHNIVATTTPTGLNVTYTADASGVVSVDTDGKITALKEGTGVITVQVGGDGVYAEKTTTVTVHVTRVLNEDNIELTIPTGGYVYDGTPKTPTVTVTVGEKTLTLNTDYTVSYSNNVNAGENTATVTVADIAGGDYNVSGTKTFSIAPKPVTLGWDQTSFTYDSNPQAPTASVSGIVGTDACTVSDYTIAATGSSSLTSGNAVNVGSYTATVTGLSNANYKLPDNPSTTFNIIASDAASAVVSANNRTYDGTAQNLVTVGTVTNGATGTAADVKFYADATSTTPLSGIPQASGAGSHTVYYEVTPDANHTTSGRLSVTVTIAKRDITVSVADKSVEYNGSEQSGNMEYSFSNVVSGQTATITYTPAKGTTAGTYDNGSYADDLKVMSGTEDVTGNYNLTTKTAGKLTITDRTTKYAITVVANSSTGNVYDGTAKSATGFKTLEFTVEGNTYTVSGLTTSDPSSTNVCTLTNAISGTAVVKDAAGNIVTSQFTVTTTNGTLEIAKRDITVSVADKSSVYSGSEQSGNTDYSFSNVVTGQTATITYTPAKGTTAGTYDNGSYADDLKVMSGTEDVTGNYNLTTKTAGKLTITDRTTKYAITVVANSSTGNVYDGTEKSATGFETLEFTVEGNTYTVSGLTTSDPSSTNVCTLTNTISGTAVVKDAANNDVTTQFTVTTTNGTLEISPKTVGLTWSNTTFTYIEAKSQAPTATVKSSDLISGDVCEVTVGVTAQTGSSLTNNEAVNVGNYTATVTSLSNSNYTLPTTGLTQNFTITAKGVNADGSTTATGTIVLGGVPNDGFTYNGQTQTPNSVTVLDGNGDPIPNGQYDVSYKNSKGETVTDPTEAGTYTVVITDKEGTGFDNYTVSGETTFIINPASGELAFENMTVTFGDNPFTPIPKTVQSDGAITFSSGNTNVISVSTDGKTLSILSASTTPVTITANQAATNDYEAETAQFTVTVNPMGVNANGTGTGSGINGQIVLTGVPNGGFTYNGQTQVPTVTVLDGNGNPIPSEQYTVSYKNSKGETVENPTEADTYTVVITDKTGTGFDNYTVSGETTFIINPANGELAFDNITVTFGDKPFTPAPKTVQSDGAITFSSGNTNVISVSTDGKILSIVSASTTPVTITANQAATNDYEAETATFTVTVNSKGVNANGTGTGSGINGQVVLTGVPEGGFTYNGQTQVPTVTVLDENGNPIPNEQYTVSYKNSKGETVENPTEADTYTVVITDKTGTGFDNYIVSGETTFTINPAKPQLVFKNITTTFEKDKDITPNASKKDSDGEITFVVEENQEVIISNNGKLLLGKVNSVSLSKQYVVTANQAATKNYTATSTTFTVSFTQQNININTNPNVVIHLDGKPQNQVSFIYSGEEWKPAVGITVNGEEVPTTDFNAEYSNNTNAGTATIDITPNPNAPIGVSGQIQFPIEKADLTISVNDVEKVYGEVDPVLTYYHGTLYGSDKLIGELEREAGEDVGTYRINQGTLRLPENTVINYNIKFAGGKLTIKPKPASNSNMNGLTVTQTYNDREAIPTITVKDGDKPLTEGTDYTLSYKDKDGKPVTEKEMKENLGEYVAVITLKGNYSGEITEDIIVKYSDITITPKNDWFTFSNAVDMTLPDGLTAYTCKLDPTGTVVLYYLIPDAKLTVNNQRIVKGGNGILLHGKAGTKYTFKFVSQTPVNDVKQDYGTTQLIPVVKPTHFKKGDIYVLSNNQFLPITESSTKVPANRAVLKLPAGTAAARVLMLVDSGTTGISATLNDNGEMINDSWYTLDGRKLDAKPTRKGMYILNGKKVVIK